MKAVVLLFAILLTAGAAAAQTRPSTGASQTNAGGAATVKSHMQSLGYKDIHELRQAPDGQWVGKATQGNVEKTVTITPNGTVIAR